MLNNKTIFLTGGTGTFGKQFVKFCLKKFKPKKIIIFSRDEMKQFNMMNSFNEKENKVLRFFIGDVRDKARLSIAMENVDYIVHAAALKQVPSAEYNPFEAVKTNILGAQNVIEVAIENGVKNTIALSTDKAVAPQNLYGATKLTSDKLFVSANNIKGNKKIKFSIVRYGNVMGSRGSVIPYFLQFKNSNYLPITHKEMTRFNITIDEGVQFVIDRFKNMWGGEIFIPKIPSVKITDVAKAIAPNAKHKIIGLRYGEKIHEEMITKMDSYNTCEFKDYYVIMPDSKYIHWDKKRFLLGSSSTKGKMCKLGFSYNSFNNGNYLSVSEIKRLIKKNKII